MTTTTKLSCWHIATTVLPHADKVLFYGPPGTGKTTTPHKLAIAADQPIENVTLYRGQMPESLLGMYIPKPDGNGGTDFVWQDGPVTRAMDTGAILVLNELSDADPAVLTSLYAALDDHDIARIDLPCDPKTRQGGNVVRPKPGFKVIGTMNGLPEELPAPLRDRFSVCINIDEVHPDALATLPEDLQHAAKETACIEPERRLSIRAWKAFANLREQAACGPEVAAAAIFGPRAQEALNALKIGAIPVPAK